MVFGVPVFDVDVVVDAFEFGVTLLSLVNEKLKPFGTIGPLPAASDVVLLLELPDELDEFETVMVMVDVAMLPAASRATALNVWLPLETAVESQLAE